MVKRFGFGLVVIGLVAGAPTGLWAEDATAAAPTATVSAERRPEVKPEASRRHWFRRHARRAEDRRDAHQPLRERLGNADIRPGEQRVIHHHRRREANADSPETGGREFHAERLRQWVQQHHDDPQSVYEWLHTHPDSEYTQNWYKPGVLGDGELLKLAPYLSTTELKQLQDAQPNAFPQVLEAWKQAHPHWQERVGREDEHHDLGNDVVNTEDPRVVADRIENSNLSREEKQALLRRLYNTTHDPNAPEDINPRALIERIKNSNLPPEVKRHMIHRVEQAYQGDEANPERRLHRREEAREEHRERLDDVLNDRRELRRDEREVRADRRDIRGDVRDLRGDLREGDRREVRGDVRDLRRDQGDFRRDVGRPVARPEPPRRSLGDRIGGLDTRGFGGGGFRGGDRGGFGGGGGGRSGGGRSGGGGRR